MVLLAPRLLLSSTILTAALVLLAPRAQAQDEAAPAAKAPETSIESAAKPAAEAAKPVEVPACNCPPPCPPPPPPPPAPPADAPEWKAQGKGGMLITTGNAESKTFSFGLNASRKQGNNKLALEGGLSYGTTNVPVITGPDVNNNYAYSRQQATTTDNWAGKGRYDRFVTEHNAAYASGQLAADKIAGKTLFGGGQVGYSRQLLNDKWNIVVAELGYDFSYERYVQQAGQTIDPVTIHSARVLLGETLSLSKATGITASGEVLFNLNKETKAINVKTNTPGVDAFKDIRVNGKLALTTNLWKELSFSFGFTVKYDENPAPRPLPKGAPAGYVLPGDLFFADKVDTITEATLIYTFF